MTYMIKKGLLPVKVKEFLAASLDHTELNRNFMDQYFLLFTTFL